MRRFGDGGPYAVGERRKRQAGQDVVRAVMTMSLHDVDHIGSRAMYGMKPAVAEMLLQIVDIERVGIDDDQ